MTAIGIAPSHRRQADRNRPRPLRTTVGQLTPAERTAFIGFPATVQHVHATSLRDKRLPHGRPSLPNIVADQNDLIWTVNALIDDKLMPAQIGGSGRKIRLG